tara:strand:+ start:310 stop:558 length:249 start_codon:yes stop_codon:yes gene_type:complete
MNRYIKIAKVIIVVIKEKPAPNPRPTAMVRNKYPNSSGSFIGVLNLTIDKAPTNPSDKARELLTTVITIKTVNPIKGRIAPT